MRDGDQLEIALLGPAADDLRQRVRQSHLLERQKTTSTTTRRTDVSSPLLIIKQKTVRYDANLH